MHGSGRARWTRLRSAGAACVAVLALAGSALAAAAGSYRYLAVIPGDCQELVVGAQALTEACDGKLVNVDFGDGRVAFIFSTPTTQLVLSGRSSRQSDLRSYELAIDHMTTDPEAPGRPASGRCTMTGDPLRERALFVCRVERDGVATRAEFRSDGLPRVYAGDRGGAATGWAQALDD